MRARRIRIAYTWDYKPTLPPLSSLACPAGQLSRGVETATGNGIIFVAEPDASLPGLHATNDQPMWKAQTDDHIANWTQPMTPPFANNMASVGGTAPNLFGRGIALTVRFQQRLLRQRTCKVKEKAGAVFSPNGPAVGKSVVGKSVMNTTTSAIPADYRIHRSSPAVFRKRTNYAAP